MHTHTVRLHGRKSGAIGISHFWLIPVDLPANANTETVLETIRKQHGLEFCPPPYSTNAPLLTITPNNQPTTPKQNEHNHNNNH
jgi:hypothetical protein